MNSSFETLNYWPIIIVIEDVHVPELAPEVMEACGEYKSEIRGLVMKLWAWEARDNLNEHRN